jgi:hypothetical protein
VSEYAQIAPIAFDIRQPFRSPELRIRRRDDAAVSAFMHVKETAVHVDDFSMSHENDVRLAGKVEFAGPNYVK